MKNRQTHTSHEMGRLGALLITSLALLTSLGAGCSDDSDDPQTIRETGYLRCDLDSTDCGGAPQCETEDGDLVCVDFPATCDEPTCDCLGEMVCGEASCAVAGDALYCDEGGDRCEELPTDNFGSCDAVLGAGVFGGACQLISGCSADDFELFDSVASCEAACGGGGGPTCAELSGEDFGACRAVLGFGVVNGVCLTISGCDAGDIELFESLDSCEAACGGSGACESDRDCGEGNYCAADGACRFDGTCGEVQDCSSPGNDWAHDDCVGEAVCGERGQCEWECATTSCEDLSGVSFGACQAVLGVGVVDGQCVAISGCDAGEVVLYEDLASCEAACGDGPTCEDVADVDFGDCRAVLGVGVVNGVCLTISGCDAGDVELFDDLDSCEAACGGSGACGSERDCGEGQYCAADGTCRFDGTCREVQDCSAPGNAWDHPACEGFATCERDTCGWVCGSGGPTCDDLSGEDFGDCDAVLGVGVVDGVCRDVSGCDTGGIELFEDLASCEESCGGSGPTCEDLAEVDFGDCRAVLGVGVVNGVCLTISGCDTGDVELFEDFESCEAACGGSAPDMCADLSGEDFGPCDAVLGVGVVDGVCRDVSGCDSGDVELFEDVASCERVCFAASCEEKSQALGEELFLDQGSCTATIRLDYQSLEVLGYQLFCGAYTSIDEATAREAAQLATGYGEAGQSLGGESPEGAYVFYEAPGDFGGVGAVSARTGLAVFGGSIVWDGAGDLTYPAQWRGAESLGSGCDPEGAIPSALGYDLAQGGEVAEADMSRVLAEVQQTAIIDAMWSRGSIFEAVVLLYPRSVGVFNPESAEWVILLNGGWLE